MASTNIQVRVDQTLKFEAEQLFADIGLDMPTAIRLFLKQSVINNGIPFTLERDPFYSGGNQVHLAKVALGLIGFFAFYPMLITAIIAMLLVTIYRQIRFAQYLIVILPAILTQGFYSFFSVFRKELPPHFLLIL